MSGSGFSRSGFTIDDGANLDAFGRLRVAQPETLYAFIPRTGKSTTDEWDESLTGSATSTYEADNTAIALETTTASGDKAIRQTQRRFIYTPGKSNQVLITANFGGTLANCRKRVGLFDELDGFIYELDGSTFNFVLRSNIGGTVSEQRIAQSSWNLDKLDGTGASKITIDPDNTQIMIFDFQWLGIGRVRMGFVVDGVPVFCHEFNHANRQAMLYMQNPNLPFRAEIENTDTTSSAGKLDLTCFSLAVEGGEAPNGRVAAITTGATAITVSTSETYLVSFRLDPNHYRQALRPLILTTLMDAGTKPAVVRAYLNTTLTGPSWVDFGTISEYDRSASAFSGGGKVSEFYINTGGVEAVDLAGALASDVWLGSLIDNTPVNLTITGQALTGTADLLIEAAFREYT